MRVALAATIHDVDGKLAEPVAALAGQLRKLFCGFAVNLTDITSPSVPQSLEQCVGATIIRHPQGERTIGKSRRDAVAAALALPCEAVLYIDFDHLIRWIERDARELSDILQQAPEADCLVVGRSESAFAREPRRLQETERLVNHVYALMRARRWDLLFAIRRLSRRAAELVVQSGQVNTIANDVEWPLLVEAHGLSLAYAAASGLYYRTMDDFGKDRDTHDDDPREWIRRVEMAAEQLRVMAGYLAGPKK